MGSWWKAWLWILVCGLCLPITERYVDAFSIISERINEIVVNGKTYLRHEITIKCDQYDVLGPGRTQTFYLSEGQPDGRVRRRKIEITCVAPVYTYTHRVEGWIPLWVSKQEYNLCLSPYTTSNMSSTQQIVQPSLLSWPILSKNQTLLGMAEDEDEFNWPLYPLTSNGPVLPQGAPFIATIGSPPLAIGTDLACLLPFLGSCGGGDIDASLANINKELAVLNKFAHQATDWMRVADQSFMEQNKFNALTKQSLDNFNSSIGALNEITSALWDFQKKTAADMTAQFTVFQSQFKEINQANKLIAEIVFQSINATDQQITQLNQITQGISQSLQNVMLSLYQWQQRLQPRRQGTRMFWDFVDKPLVPPLIFADANQPICKQDKKAGKANPLCDYSMEAELPSTNPQPNNRIRPFLPWPNEKGAGVRPPNEPFTGKHGEKYAIRMALGSILFTDDLAGRGPRPHSVRMELLCDPEFTLNNHIPSIPLRTLLERLGPAGCDKPNINDWRCKCIVRAIDTTCTSMPSTNLFPWDYPTVLAVDDPKTGLSGCTPGNTVYSTSSTEMNVFMANNLCTMCPIFSLNRLRTIGHFWKCNPLVHLIGYFQTRPNMDRFKTYRGTTGLVTRRNEQDSSSEKKQHIF